MIKLSIVTLNKILSWKKIIHGNLAHPFNVNKKYSPQKHIQIETKIFKVTDHFC